jgi:hypothetical protein
MVGHPTVNPDEINAADVASEAAIDYLNDRIRRLSRDLAIIATNVAIAVVNLTHSRWVPVMAVTATISGIMANRAVGHINALRRYHHTIHSPNATRPPPG